MQDACGVGADISPQALLVAEKNARNLEVDKRARLVESDLFSSPFFEEKTGKDQAWYDILISNPPYIRSADIEELYSIKGEQNVLTPLLGQRFDEKSPTKPWWRVVR